MAQSVQTRRVQTWGLATVVVALIATVLFALQREFKSTSIAPPAATSPPVHAVHALTPAEDSYADALWPIHSELKLNAVKMIFAGLSYTTDERNLAKLDAKLQPLIEGFRAANVKARGLEVPASLQKLHEHYLDALALYEAASIEMAKVTRAGDEAHLLDAHVMSLRAAENLLRVGEVLWPAEHKPH